MKRVNPFLILIGFLFLASCGNKGDGSIAIQPFEKLDQEVMDSISSRLGRAYNCNVVQLKSISLPQNAFIHVKSPRYRADSLLVYLKHIKPDSIAYIIGLTDKDISTTKRDKRGEVRQPEYKYQDWGVFGLGYRPGSSCVISTFRVHKTDRQTFIQRMQKIAIHEIGHNKGLSHCPSVGCVMQDAAETIRTIDQVGFELCEKCKREI